MKWYRVLLSILVLNVGVFAGSAQASEMIFFTTFDDYTHYLTEINLDGTHKQILASSYSGWFEASPDGEKIVLLQHRSGTIMEGEYDIYLFDYETSELIQLTESHANVHPIWSPDGGYIAYLSGQDEEFDIYLISLDDLILLEGNLPLPMRLTDLEGSITELAWSPDGQQLAFVVCETGSSCSIYLMLNDGTGLREVPNDFDGSIVNLAWSPDSRSIALVAFPNDDLENANIHILDVVTGEYEQVSDEQATYWNLIWSPDGNMLAYSSNKSGEWDIFAADISTFQSTNLTVAFDFSSGYYGLDWSPDSSQIVFSANDGEGDFELFIMNKDGSDIVQITANELHDSHPRWISRY